MSPRRVFLAALVAVLVTASSSSGRASTVDVALTPASQLVGTDQEFDLVITCTAPGASFNGFTTTVTFDPAALTFVPASPMTLQEGCVMTGADSCSNACGVTFHRFSADADSLSITDILLCNQVTLTGPGPLYRLRFKSASTSQITQVRFRSIVFYDGGTLVDTVTTADATIEISSLVGVGDPHAEVPGVRLMVAPNPARGPVTLTAEADVAGSQTVIVRDVAGRVVRRLASGWFDRGARKFVWDGEDFAGNRVRPGLYWVLLRAGARESHVRVTMIE